MLAWKLDIKLHGDDIHMEIHIHITLITSTYTHIHIHTHIFTYIHLLKPHGGTGFYTKEPLVYVRRDNLKFYYL